MNDAPAASRSANEPPSIASRLFAVLLDVLLLGAVAGVGTACAWPLARGCTIAGCEIIVLVGPALGASLLVATQLVFFARSGQTVGMRRARIRIADADGAPAGVVRGVLLRGLPLLLAPAGFFLIANAIWESASQHADTSSLVARFGYNGLDNLTTALPLACTAVFLVADLAPALWPGRRALHDRVAGTWVVRCSGGARSG